MIKGESISRADFLAEATVMANMKPHPYVLLFYGVHSSIPPYYIVTPFMEGGSLDTLLYSNKEISREQLTMWIKQIGHGLYHIHEEKICHRDLSARNILLEITESGEKIPKISDFGCCFSN